MKTAVRVLVTHSAAEEEFFWKKIYWHSYSSNVFLSNFDSVTVWFLFGSKKKTRKKEIFCLMVTLSGAQLK